MPVIGLRFRQAAWPRGGHLGGNCRERQPVLQKLRFLVTAQPACISPCGFLTFRKRDRDGGAPATAPLSPATRSRTWRGLHQRTNLFRLSALAAPTHNRSNNEDGLQCARSLAAGWRVKMSEKIYDVPADWAKRAWVDQSRYQQMYARSVSDPNGFWAEQAKRIGWMKPFTKVENSSFAPGKISIKWFEDGVLNVAWNCIDRHLHTRGDQTAIIWEGDNPSESKHITYRQLHDEVCKFANILRTRNVKKGDRVTIYLPMIPEAAYAMLACARIGAVHSVVFAGFSPDSLAQRITDCQSKIVITADEGLRGGKKVPLKANVDAAIAKSGGVDWVVVVKRTGAAVDMNL